MTQQHDGPSLLPERYLSDRFEWAAPGDQQEDAWIVRFCDKDCGEAIFTGPDAEREAWDYWNRYARSYNIYVFRLASLRSPEPSEGWQPIETAPKDGTWVQTWSDSYGLAKWAGDVFPDDPWDGATHWRPLPAPPSLSLLDR